MSMDAVFKALADRTRRGMLDALFKEDGQTLGALGKRVTMRWLAGTREMGTRAAP